jgi:glycosyltransferase involved in cell wall biosynthesis
MSNDACTVVICARNSASTVGRAVASAYPLPVLLLDDGSTDATGDEARRFARSPLHVVRNDVSRGLGHARRLALAAVETPWIAWLDADDEYEANRLDPMIDAARQGADLVFDGAHVFDGASLEFLRTVRVPRFLSPPGALVRSFERNYLPGSAWPLARTSFARQVDYDTGQPSAEDIDFLLRAIRAGGRCAVTESVGYRQYAYPTSLSRDLARHGQMVRRALLKHEYDEVARLYDHAGLAPRIAAWALCTMAVFRDEFGRALEFAEASFPDGADGNEVLEPDGPLPVSEGWRAGFTKGTLLTQLGHAGDAVPCFARAALHDGGRVAGAPPRSDTPDLLNNWGVALAKLGRHSAAREKFAAALAAFPAYVDAARNRAGDANHLTLLPLRRLPSRHEY